jgi:hypothetical protein
MGQFFAFAKSWRVRNRDSKWLLRTLRKSQLVHPVVPLIRKAKCWGTMILLMLSLTDRVEDKEYIGFKMRRRGRCDRH